MGLYLFLSWIFPSFKIPGTRGGVSRRRNPVQFDIDLTTSAVVGMMDRRRRAAKGRRHHIFSSAIVKYYYLFRGDNKKNLQILP